MINENKIMLYGNDARKPIYLGMKKVYDAVRITMGPAGRNVLIEDVTMKPMATKDGVTVAKSIKLSDKKQDMGAQLIKSVSQKTADTSGDGTSTSTVLSFSLLENGLNYLSENKFSNLIDYKRGMDKATDDVVAMIKEYSIPCETKEDIYKVAMISSNGDEKISELVTEAVYNARKLTKDGSITIETSNKFENSVELNDAMVLHGGYGRAYPFVNDLATNSVMYDNVRVLLFDGSLGDISPSLIGVFQECRKNNEALVIIANEFSNNVILNLTHNVNKNGLKCTIIESPDSGTQRRNVLGDIAIATSTKIFGGEGTTISVLESLTHKDLGYAKNVQVFSDKSYIKLGITEEHAEINGLDYDEFNNFIYSSIKDRSAGILKSVEKSKNAYEIRQAEKRAENLSAIKATINVYALTEVEVNEIKQRTEDAVFATTSAIEEGYVLGSGLTLAKIAKHLYENSDELKDDKRNISFINGYKNVLISISRPFIQILNNAFHTADVLGVETGDEEFTTIDVDFDLESVRGFNVRTLQYVDDMVESGIIDPSKVIRCAIQNANSVSSVALTTGCMIFSDAYYTEELASRENHELMFAGDR